MSLRVSNSVLANQVNDALPLVNLPTFAQLAQKQALAQKNQIGGYAGLDASALLTTALFDSAAVQLTADKDQANGYAGLDSSARLSVARVPTSVQLQSGKDQANGYAGLDAGGRVATAALGGLVELTSNKGQTSGYCPLNSSGEVPLANLPATVELLAQKNQAGGYAGLDGSSQVAQAQWPTSVELTANKAAASGYCPLDGAALVPLVHIPPAVELTSARGAANGYASLDGTGKIPSAQLASSSSSLAALTDVTLSAPASGQYLAYDSSLSKWVNRTPAAGEEARRFAAFPDFLAPNASICLALLSADRHKFFFCHTAQWLNSADGTTSTNKKLYAVDFFDGTYRQPAASTIVKSFVLGNTVYVWFDDFSLWSFGSAASGQLTSAGTTDSNWPVYMPDVRNFWASTSGHVGASAFFFINNNNVSIQAKGANAVGQLGSGNTTNQTSFFTHSAITFPPSDVRNIWITGSSNGATFIELTTGDKIFAAGWNANGRLGNGNTTNQTSFVEVTANWGVAAPIVNLIGAQNDSGTNEGYHFMHKRLAGVDYIYFAGYGPVSGVAALSGTTNVSTPVQLSLAFLGVGETVSSLSGVGQTTSSARLLLLSSLGNLFIWAHNLNCTAVITTPTLLDTNITGVFNSGVGGWANQSTTIPVWVTKNNVLHVGGDYIGNTLPTRTTVNTLTTLVPASIQLVNASATIVDVRSVGNSTVVSHFVLDSLGYVYWCGVGDNTFTLFFLMDAATVPRQFLPINNLIMS